MYSASRCGRSFGSTAASPSSGRAERTEPESAVTSGSRQRGQRLPEELPEIPRGAAAGERFHHPVGFRFLVAEIDERGDDVLRRARGRRAGLRREELLDFFLQLEREPLGRL